ncbi:MAG: CbtA family protein [Alphaproteobacteria bacterium]
MIARVLLVAVAAGIVAGLAATVLQLARVTPLILEAERYETAAANGLDGEAPAGDDDAAWAPADGAERLAYTLLANVLTGIGFGLLLAAGFVLRGRRVDWRRGLVWGVAGFAVFSLAPALGLPPELPGISAAALGARQVWWLGAVLATGAGLAVIAFLPRTVFRIAGAVLIVLPHLVGAPHPAAPGGGVPPALAAEFTVASLASAALFWTVLGGVGGLLFDRFGPARP